MKNYRILVRHQYMANTDPQRRCYNGCNFSEELRWTAWGEIDCAIPEDRLEARLAFWRDLNDYAVKARGEEARAEYRAEELNDEVGSTGEPNLVGPSSD